MGMQPSLAREPDAFRALMREHNQALFRTARAILRDDAEAEEAVQEAWMQAYKGLETFRGDSKISTWLIRIVANEALGRLRRRRPALVDLDDLENVAAAEDGNVVPFPLNASQPDPERAMAQSEINSMLEKAIDALPDAFRTVLVARVIEEMSVEETATLFDLEPATVKTRQDAVRAACASMNRTSSGLSSAGDVYSVNGVAPFRT